MTHPELPAAPADMSVRSGAGPAACGTAAYESISSFAQRRMWLAEQINPGTPMYTVVNAHRITGSLDPNSLRRSLQVIVNRHEVLRTGFAFVSGDVKQRVFRPSHVPLPIADLSALPPPERERRAGQMIGEAGVAVLDLAAGEVFRALLIRLDATLHILVVTVHHIAFDAWSEGLFFQELATCYGAFVKGDEPRLQPLPLQYAEFAADQRRQVGGRLGDGVGYWRRQLAHLPDTEMPRLGSRPELPSWRADRLTLALPPRASAYLMRLGSENRATPFMTYLAAFQVLLGRYGETHDLSVATAISGRTASELEDVIGPFVDTLILRGDLGGNPTFVDLLARTRSAALDAYTHQEVPFDHVVEEMGAGGALGRNPFTQVFFVMQESEAGPLALPGLEIEPVSAGGDVIRADLRLGIELGSAGAWATWDYRTNLYDASYITSVGNCFGALIEGIAADPRGRVRDLPLLTGAQRANVVALGAGPPVRPSADTVHGRFARQALTTPHVPAVVAEDATLSYRQLDHAAERLAAQILREVGCAAGDRVAVAVDRCAAMTVAVLAVLKAGGCYVPLDPESPSERCSAIVAEAKPVAILVTEQAPVALHPGEAPLITVDVRALCDAAAPDPVPAPAPANSGALAYILYTSGSTGVPKGVAVTHGQIHFYLAGVDDVAGLPAARYAIVQPLAVDASVTMLYGAWYHGGTLFVVPAMTALDAPALANFMQQNDIEILKIAPTHLQTLQQTVPPAELMPARWLMIGGEASSSAWASSLTSLREGCAVYNHYGPTEATVGVLMHKVEEAASTAPHHTLLGFPLRGTRLYVLDRNGEPLPPMVRGEIFIGGALVALGYDARPGLTAEHFLPDRFVAEAGSRMYRTGDRGRIRPDGGFEFLGRSDDQIKVRGYRVELGEIVAVLQEHPAVRQAAVRSTGDAGEAAIVAFVALQPNEPGNPPDDAICHGLRNYVAQRLPSYMVPVAVMPLHGLPLSAHGKLDASALPAVGAPAGDGPVPAASPLEAAIITAWQDVLGIPGIGRHDDFFQLGGHSLLATRAAGRLTSALGTPVSVAALFRHRTPAALGAQLRRPGTHEALDSVLVELGPEPELHSAPVICLHPVGGEIACYVELARELTGHHVVGVQASERTLATPPTSVPAIANSYLAAIRHRWPTGPLVLVGWSMGGLLAYELAQQLADAGDPPQRTILIDTVLEDTSTGDPPEAAVAAALARHIAAGLDVDQQPPDDAGIARLDLPGRLAAMQRWLAANGIAEGRYEVFRANLLAQRHYQPARSAVPITLINATETPNQEARWRQLVGERLTFKQFSGDHYSLLSQPTVAGLASWIQRHVERMVGAHGE